MKLRSILLVIAGIFAAVQWTPAGACAGVLKPEECYTWGISTADVEIPEGSIITEAVLTIHDISGSTDDSDDTLYIHLLDAVPAGFLASADSGQGDFFSSRGTVLTPPHHSRAAATGHLVYKFSELTDPESWVWQFFDSPQTFGPKSEMVIDSSLLLELIDYAGTEPAFGFGFDLEGGGIFRFGKITLDLTIQSFEDDADPATITLTAPTELLMRLPNGGERYNVGDRLIARWMPGMDLQSNVQIKLYKGDTAVYTIGSSTENDGGKGRLLPETVPVGNDYRIRVASVADESVYDFSDGYFSIIDQPDPVVVWPDGGEQLQIGASYIFKWTVSDPEGYVKIELYRGEENITTIASSTPDDGKKGKILPATLPPGDDYRVRVTSLTNGSYDVSNGDIEIVPADFAEP